MTRVGGVIPRVRLSGDAIRLAQLQAGVLSREQLVSLGISDRVIARMAAGGELVRVVRGVYATTSGGWTQLAWAGVLAGGVSTVVGGEAAAYLHGLLPDAPSSIRLYVTDRRVQHPAWQIVKSPRRGIGDPPRTRMGQTVLDCAGSLSPGDLMILIAQAMRRRPVVAAEIESLLTQAAWQPQRRLIADMVGAVKQGAESPLELRYLREVEKAHGLPRAVRQARLSGSRRVDVWYQEYALVVELDGRAYHRGAAVWRDMDRDNEHQLLGLTTMRFGWQQVVTSPCRVASTVAAVLRTRGWPGIPTTCPRCRK
jgi:very-short-patch-repair endonuclease